MGVAFGSQHGGLVALPITSAAVYLPAGTVLPGGWKVAVALEDVVAVRKALAGQQATFVVAALMDKSKKGAAAAPPAANSTASAGAGQVWVLLDGSGSVQVAATS